MKTLFLSPVRRDEKLKARIEGEVLYLNDEVLDFGPLPLNATLPKHAINSNWVCGDVSRDELGNLSIHIIIPHGPNAPEETRFPSPIVIEEDGDITLPLYGEE